MRQKIVTVTLLLGGLLMSPASAVAQDNSQDDSAEETDPVVEALEKEKKLAELEKAIAEAEKATLSAKLPDTEGSGVEGSVTFGEGSGYFAEMLAYRSLTEAAEQVAADLGPPPTAGQRLLVVAGDVLAKQAPLWEIASARVDDADLRLQALIDKYKDYQFTVDEAVATALTTATALLGAAADVASFFRSDLAVTARTVNVGSTALLAAGTARLKARDWQPVLPAASLGRTVLQGKVEKLLASRRALVSRRSELEQRVQPELAALSELKLELAAAEADLEAAKKAKPVDPAKVQAAEQKVRDLKQKILPKGILKARWERAAAEIDATLAATDALVKALAEGAQGKPSTLESVAAVDVAKADETVKVLQLEISSQGGEMHVSKSAWRTRLTYVGGVAVSYFLMDQRGAVEASGIVARPIAQSVRAKAVGTKLSGAASVDSKPRP